MLEAHPTSAGIARRHVAQALAAAPLAELVDTASLLVSEIVTNAVLHAGTAIELSCRVVGGSVQVKVRDHSAVIPSQRHFDVAATTGRGLGMVELLADEWGVDADEWGKTVWFLLAGPDIDSVGPHISPAEPTGPAYFDVHLLHLPAALVIATIQYGDTVLREQALLAIGSPPAEERSRDWQTPGIDLGPVLRRAERALEAGDTTIDVVLGFPAGAGTAALERLALVDKADRLARRGELLTPPAVPEIAVCRRWLYTQIDRQAGGAAPQAWATPESPD